MHTGYPPESAHPTKSKRFGILLLRGLLGGAVGGFLLAAWSVLARMDVFQTNWDQWLFAFYFLGGLPVGLCGGGITSLTIWLVNHFTQKDLGPVLRFVTGTLIASVGLTIFFLIKSKAPPNVSDFSSYKLLATALLGIGVGGLPGLFVGNQQHRGIRTKT